MKTGDCIFARSSLAAGLLAAALCPAAETKTAPGKVTAVRFWSLGEVTRVAVEVSSEFRFRAERLPDPERLFFDIQGATPAMAGKGMQVINVGDGVLKQIRVAETQPGVTRVVLDLEDHAQYTASQLANPDRLMIELRLKDKPAPPATASVTGAKALSDAPAAPIAPDLVVMKPETPAVDKPTPVLKRFVPPALVQDEPPKAAPPPDLLAPPPSWIASKPVHPLPPYVPPMAIARTTAPPPAPLEPAAAEPVKPKPDLGPAVEPAKRDANGQRSLTRVLGLKLGRVVIDPGHGGHDVGTHGASGVYEKDIVLDVAKRLGALMEERLNSEVVFTRTDDSYVALEQRTEIANDHKADLFLSIHVNSSPLRNAAGVETYYLNFTTSRTALDLAARENASSEKSVFDLKDLLQKIALKDKVDESREFATRLQASLYSVSSKGNTAARNRGVKKAPFVVLIGASMPSVLAEIGFLTNSADETLLRKPEHRQKIAEALYKGIANYADTLSHFQVAKRN